MYWQTSRFRIDLSQPKVMGIVNTTPDSFSDGGVYNSVEIACARCERLIEEGADILDIGGESTRPGASPVPVQEELNRILPVLRHALTLGVPVSVDTYKPQVMRVVLDMGADIINDVWALRWRESPDAESAPTVVAAYPDCGVCLMHMHGKPATMQSLPMQGEVVSQVRAFLQLQTQSLQTIGVRKQRICIDPGIGFGKTVAQNFALLAHQRELCALGYPVLAGWSRKSSLLAVTSSAWGSLATATLHERLAPSIAAALLAVQRGANVLRVHDVQETVQALKVWLAVQAADALEATVIIEEKA